MKKNTMVVQVDLYTRIVLTIIAVCLAGILIKPMFTVLQADAQPKELKKEIQNVNIALINGQPPEKALPLQVNITNERTIGVKIEEPALLPVSVEKSATVPVTIENPEALNVNIARSEVIPVSIEKPDALTVNIARAEIIPVSIIAPDVLETRVVDSITIPVEITGPFPLPEVQTLPRY
jgi:hypothetical protein